MMNRNELPEGWVDVRLGDFAKTEKGRKPKVLSSERTEAYPIPYVNIKAFEKNVIDEYTDGKGCVICEDDDFLMVWDGSRSGYVGKAISGALGSTLVRIKFPNVDHDYAYFFLQSKFIEINTRAKGVGIPHVDPNLVWNYRFPLPPLPTQHAIVTKIEEIFSELDHGVAQLKTARAQLKVYKQAVLKWAFEGRLTNVGVVEGELPEGWQLVNIGAVVKCIVPNRDKPKSFSGNIPWLTTPDLDEGSIVINFSGIKNGLSKEEIIEYKAKIIPVDSVVMTCVGKFGVAAVVTKEIVINQQLHAFLPSEVLLPKYIAYNIINQKTYCESKSTSTTIAYLNKENCNSIPIPLCSLSEQHLIVSEIERRLSVCDKMEEVIAGSLRQAEVVRQGVLKRAFEGSLV